jgi:hypothetical protein
MNGIALWQSVRSKRPKTKVVFMSGSAIPDDVDGTPFVSRPFTLAKLVENRNDVDSRGSKLVGSAKRSEAGMRLITTSPGNIEEFGTLPVVSEFAAPKLLPRLITVCAWCKGTQNADGFWRHAENDLQTDAETAVSHGICPECAEKSYNEYRLATFAASAHLASAPAA